MYWLVRSLPPASFCMWGRWESGPAWRVSPQPTSSTNWTNQWVCVLEIKQVGEKGCDLDLGLRRTNKCESIENWGPLLRWSIRRWGRQQSGTATEAPIWRRGCSKGIRNSEGKWNLEAEGLVDRWGGDLYSQESSSAPHRLVWSWAQGKQPFKVYYIWIETTGKDKFGNGRISTMHNI